MTIQTARYRATPTACLDMLDNALVQRPEAGGVQVGPCVAFRRRLEQCIDRREAAVQNRTLKDKGTREWSACRAAAV